MTTKTLQQAIRDAITVLERSSKGFSIEDSFDIIKDDIAVGDLQIIGYNVTTNAKGNSEQNIPYSLYKKEFLSIFNAEFAAKFEVTYGSFRIFTSKKATGIVKPAKYSDAKMYLNRKYEFYLECVSQQILRKKRSDITVEQLQVLFEKHQTWRGVAKELKTSTGRLYLIREGLGMISSQNRKKKEKELSE